MKPWIYLYCYSVFLEWNGSTLSPVGMINRVFDYGLGLGLGLEAYGLGLDLSLEISGLTLGLGT